MAGNKSSIVIDMGQGFSLVLGTPTVNLWTTKERPKKAKQGSFGFNSETNNLECFDGKNWLAASFEKIET